MPFPPHYLLSFGGDFGSDQTEVWNNNIRIAVDDNLDGAAHVSASPEDVDAALNAVVPKITTHLQHVDSGYSLNTRLRYVKLNEIDAQGRYKDQSNVHTYFSPVGSYPQGAGTPIYPLPTSMVVTFLTSAERGPASRGRVFVPQPAVAISGSTFRIAAAKATAIVTQWRAFLDGIEMFTAETPIPSPHVPAVVSDRGTGVARTINQCQVGDVLDYMGSRRSKLKETRVTSASFN